MRVSLVTPDASFFDGEATKVVLPGWDGELGILAHHAPLIARLGYGVARINDGTRDHRFALYGGFVKVQDDVVTVLAGGAATATGELDAAEAALATATEKLREIKAQGTASLIPEAEEQVRRAHANLKLLHTDRVPSPHA